MRVGDGLDAQIDVPDDVTTDSVSRTLFGFYRCTDFFYQNFLNNLATQTGGNQGPQEGGIRLEFKMVSALETLVIIQKVGVSSKTTADEKHDDGNYKAGRKESRVLCMRFWTTW